MRSVKYTTATITYSTMFQLLIKNGENYGRKILITLKKLEYIINRRS